MQAYLVVSDAVVSSKGPVTLPAALRAQLGLRPGSHIRFELRGKELVIKPELPTRASCGMPKPHNLDPVDLLVPVMALYEVHNILSRKAPQDVVRACLDVIRMGRVLALTDARAVAAADVSVKHNLAMADAVMYCLAREFNATFWTQDIDCQGLPGVHCFAKP